MAKTGEYFLFDIKKNLYCDGCGDFLKINECRSGGYGKDRVKESINETRYPYHDGEWFFVEFKEDGSIRILQKGDEI